MFDKLIESDTAGAEFKNRSRYFTVSTIIVGILFLTAVVYSLYAAEVGLGAVNFEIAKLVVPLETREPEPERPREQTETSDTADRPMRQQIMASTNVPTNVPTRISIEKNPYASTDPKRYDNMETGPKDIFGPGIRLPEGTGGTSSPTTSRQYGDSGEEDPLRSDPPPPAVKKPAIVRTSRVLNGDALSLPKPTYPRPAVMLNLESTVKVQVTIDENGNVVSAKAAEGHPLFRGVAEQAARGAKFKPTYLNDAAVKVTGLITYHFRKPN